MDRQKEFQECLEYREEHRDTWNSLVDLFREWPEGPERSQAYQKLAKRLEDPDWKDRYRVMYYEPDHPLWPLVRFLNLNLFLNDDGTIPVPTDLEHITHIGFNHAQRIPHYERLEFIAYTSNFAHLEGLHLDQSFNLTNFHLLERMKNLKELYIKDIYNLTCFHGIEKLVHLERLELGIEPVDVDTFKYIDLYGGLILAADLPKLRHLSLTFWPMLDKLWFDVARYFPKLQSLNLSNSSIQDLRSLSELVGLTDLKLWSCKQIQTLTGLEKLSQLTTLDLSRCTIDTLSPLRELEQLSKLHLSYATIEDLSDLRELKELTELHLIKYQGSSIPFVKEMHKLQWLNLNSSPNITDIEALSELQELETLSLGEASLVEPKPLLELPGLRSLDLSFDPKQIPVLKQLKQLKHLSLSTKGNEELKTVAESYHTELQDALPEVELFIW